MQPIGAIASASALLILLLGPPGYGIARRSQVIGVAVLIGAAAAIGALLAAQPAAIVLVLLLLGGFFAVASAHATRHELLGFAIILALVAVEVRIPVRADVMVLTAIAIAITGAWRADRGVVPLWSILGTLLVLIATVA